MVKLRLVDRQESPSDRELIDQTVAGDQGAYAILVGRYQKKIFRMAYAIVRSEQDADTITQDTFVTAYLNIRQFEGRSEFETWLTRIAINKSRDQLRSRRWSFVSLSGSDDEASGIDPADGRPDPERLVAADQISRAIDAAVDSLSAQQKTIFRLRHFEDMPLEEIARLMNLAPGTVRAHLFRAVHKVRKELEEWGVAAAPEEAS